MVTVRADEPLDAAESISLQIQADQPVGVSDVVEGLIEQKPVLDQTPAPHQKRTMRDESEIVAEHPVGIPLVPLHGHGRAVLLEVPRVPVNRVEFIVLLEKGRQGSHCSGVGIEIVRRNGGNEVARGGTKPFVERRVLPPIVARPPAHLRVTAQKRDGRAAVGRTVVDDNMLDPPIVLRLDRVQQLFEVARRVVRRRDDRYQRRLGHAHPARRTAERRTE